MRMDRSLSVLMSPRQYFRLRQILFPQFLPHGNVLASAIIIYFRDVGYSTWSKGKIRGDQKYEVGEDDVVTSTEVDQEKIIVIF